MTLLNPTAAPFAHVEMLPATSIAAEAVDATAANDANTMVKITTWSPGGNTMYGEGGEESPGEWCEENCHGCSWHTDEVSWDADGTAVDTPEGSLNLVGTYYTQSPCNCYDDGIESVSFPCHEGLDGPDGSDDEDEWELDTSQLKYEIKQRLYEDGSTMPSTTYAMQQGCEVVDNKVYVTASNLESVNTYHNDHHICWNDNTDGASLLEVEDCYVASEANQDLCSFSTHEHNASLCKRSDKDTHLPQAVPTPTTEDERAKGLAVAHARQHISAFMLIATNGGVINGSVAYLPVYLYPQVAIDDDTIVNVWATDPLPTGKRLLFTSSRNEKNDPFSVLLGAVDQNFNLLPCKSLQQQSSAQAAQDNKLSLV